MILQKLTLSRPETGQQGRTKWFVWCKFHESLYTKEFEINERMTEKGNNNGWGKGRVREHGENMEHRRTNQNRQSLSVYSWMLLSVQMQPGYIWLVPVTGYVKNINKFSGIMLCMWLFGSNWFLMFCSRNAVIEAVETQLLFERPKVWPLDTELAQSELML